MNSTLPNSLTAYRDALEDAARRELGRSRSRRRLRLAVVAVAVAAGALGALSLFLRNGTGASVVDRAAAAVAASPGTILHVDMHGSQTNPDGSTITWRNESWEQQSPPYAGRQIQTSPDGSVVETASTGSSDELYDAARDTIYIRPQVNEKPYAMDSWDLKPGPRPGTVVLRVGDVKAGRIFGTTVITTAQAEALRKHTDVIGFKLSKRNGVAAPTVTVMPAPKLPKAKPEAPDADPTSTGFRGQILTLLRSGGAHVVGHRTIDGQDTIEIASANGHTTYYVDPGSYQPVELDTRGTGGGTALRFPTYETLGLDGNEQLLSLTAQHPGTRVDHDPADYAAAEARLFPNG